RVRCCSRHDEATDPGAGQAAGAGGVDRSVPQRACYGTAKNCALPGRLSEPGPGRSARLSRARLLVDGMQKLLTSTPAGAWPAVRSPAGEPFCMIASVPV